jgi:hypothetical protein
MTPFFETPDQVDLDISLGCRYCEAPIGDHTRETRINDRSTRELPTAGRENSSELVLQVCRTEAPERRRPGPMDQA